MKKIFPTSFLLVLIFLTATTVTPNKSAQHNALRGIQKLSTAGAKNIVMVHGAFADGSGFKDVYRILTKEGFHVTIVQNPLTSLQADVDATLRILDKQDGPTILVGHSWGGTVITEAGMHPNVVALVYIAAFQPGAGETTAQWLATQPAAPENGILPPDKNGVVYFDQAKFHAGFAGDLPKEESEFLSASQGPIYAKCFTTPVTAAAWKTKPSYGIVPSQDKAINPEILRNMYKRSNTAITELTGSHLIYMSKPAPVADIIRKAANG